MWGKPSYIGAEPSLSCDSFDYFSMLVISQIILGPSLTVIPDHGLGFGVAFFFTCQPHTSMRFASLIPNIVLWYCNWFLPVISKLLLNEACGLKGIFLLNSWNQLTNRMVIKLCHSLLVSWRLAVEWMCAIVSGWVMETNIKCLLRNQ